MTEPAGAASHLPLDTVVFDLGGVLADWDPRFLYRELFDGDEAAMDHFLTTVCTPEWNHSMDAGRSRAQAVAELVAEQPEHEELIRAWVDRWQDMLGEEIAGTAAVVSELKARGTRLFALTNWSGETFPVARTIFPSFADFEGIVVSGDHGVAKPEPAVFALLTHLHGVEPGRAAYVDDKADNVEAAEALGFTGLLFTEPGVLRADLVRLALLPELIEPPR